MELSRDLAQRGQTETQRLQGKGQRELRGAGEKRCSHVTHLTGPESEWQGMSWTLREWAVCRMNRDFLASGCLNPSLPQGVAQERAQEGWRTEAS